MAAEQSDPQEITKLKIREWLKEEGLSIKWLASWLNRSEGTAKNWFYGTKQITEENLDAIEVIQQKYHKKEITRELNPEYYSNIQETIRPNDYSDILTVGFFKRETDVALISHAIGVPREAFRNYTDDISVSMRTKGYLKAGRVVCPNVDEALDWVDRALTVRTKTSLSNLRRKYGEENKRFSVLSLPAVDMFFETEEEMFKSDKWYIEVPSSFKTLYARIAAKADGFESFNDWVNDTLVRLATAQIDMDLDSFLGSYSDDEIPF